MKTAPGRPVDVLPALLEFADDSELYRVYRAICVGSRIDMRDTRHMIMIQAREDVECPWLKAVRGL